jgi:protein-S-isoprenylcysteine O-methyltransferase Ste14
MDAAEPSHVPPPPLGPSFRPCHPQHPIYGSYMLLFAGYCLLCHSLPFAVLAAWVCALYYRGRAALEAQVLSEAFGEAYEDYRARTPKLFVPWVA